MRIDSKKIVIPSVESTIATLTRHSQSSGLYFDAEKVKQLYAHSLVMENECKTGVEKFMGISKDQLKDSAVKQWLIENGKGEFFLDTSEKPYGSTQSNFKLSLGKASMSYMLNSNLDQTTKMVMQLYVESSSYAKKATYLLPYINYPLEKELSYEGRTMIKVQPPEWVPQNTGRVGTREPNLNGFPRDFMNIVTVPKGYIKFEADSSQIEPRTIYSTRIPDPKIKALINLYDDAYWGVLHYVNLTPEERKSDNLVFEKMDISNIKDKRDKIKTYNNAVAYGSTSNKDFDPIKDKLVEQIAKNPYRIQWVDEVNTRIDHGITVTETYFGTKIDIRNGEENLTRQSWFNRMLNNAIQGTAADLMRYAISIADKTFRQLSPESFIIKSQYDSLAFMIKEEDYPKLEDYLKQCVAYEVDDWIPIPCEWQIGRTESKIADLKL